jgi:SAM-dependent methyltransferase
MKMDRIDPESTLQAHGEESSSQISCRICDNSQGNVPMSVREMMFGMQERFSYLHCSACGVLHLVDVPSNLSRYYPSGGYYSVSRRSSTLRQRLMRMRDRGYAVESLLGRWLVRMFPNGALDATLRHAPHRNMRILDVGCGGGELLQSLSRLGFKHLYGVDPLLEKSTSDGSVHLVAGNLESVSGEFDLITFHHSLEHMPDQVDTLARARERLAPGGRVVVRIPTCDSLAFQLYGADWFQIDAPRHLFLHSHRSIALVAGHAGLKVEAMTCDSQAMQFWASDMYRDGVILNSPKLSDYKVRRKRFYRELSTFLNVHRRGDQLIVCLQAG